MQDLLISNWAANNTTEVTVIATEARKEVLNARGARPDCDEWFLRKSAELATESLSVQSYLSTTMYGSSSTRTHSYGSTVPTTQLRHGTVRTARNEQHGTGTALYRTVRTAITCVAPHHGEINEKAPRRKRALRLEYGSTTKATIGVGGNWL